MKDAVKSEVVFRSFEPRDREAFRTLNEAWIEKFFRLEEKDRQTLGDPERYILGEGGYILMADQMEKPIGCCALVSLGDNRFEVAKMTVAESERGRGLGRWLLEHVVVFAKEKAIAGLYLETNTALANAIHIYEAVGFKHVPAERVKPSPYARANVFMEMRLA